jgi:4-alpha-glucanotransferase
VSRDPARRVPPAPGPSPTSRGRGRGWGESPAPARGRTGTGGEEPAALRELAGVYGVQTRFTGLQGRQVARPEVLLAVLQALGAPVARVADAPAALRAARQARWQQGVEPVQPVWQGAPAAVTLRLPAALADAPLACTLALEDGVVWRWRAAEAPAVGAATVEGAAYVVRRVPLPPGLPIGYHRLTLRARGRRWRTTLFVAPPRAYPSRTSGGRGQGRGDLPAPSPGLEGPAWGLFLPLYALRTARDWGCGDFTDLRALLDWMADLGGRLLGSLPLLAAFLDDVPFEYSPYAPVSRLAWNELYIDPTALPEFAACAAAREHVAAPAFQAEQARLRALPEVDYRAVAALKRPVLAALADALHATGGPRRAAFEAYLAAHPEVADYARFRAATEQRRAPWPQWPEPQREGRLDAADYDPAAWRYHAYAQWVAHEQLAALRAAADQRGACLYLDLPLGVHPDGYDVWRERAAFAQGVSGGAPPDMFFTGGQVWGFPPLHPEGIRRQGYRYFIAAVRHHLRVAGLLRIDHVMAFHRLYWVPAGCSARDGVYVRYRPDEFYAVLGIESHRHRAAIVGEDLGIVPAAVRQQMARRGLLRMYTALYEARPDDHRALSPVPAQALACVATHDMPTWAGYWEEHDIAQRAALGLLDAAGAVAARQERARLRAALTRFLGARGLLPYPLPAEEVRWEGDYLWLTGQGDRRAAQSVLSGLLGWLATSPAPLVLINLEDLWFETRPQNVPGTWREEPNWRRKTRYPLEAFARLPELLAMLGGVARQRAVAPLPPPMSGGGVFPPLVGKG